MNKNRPPKKKGGSDSSLLGNSRIPTIAFASLVAMVVCLLAALWFFIYLVGGGFQPHPPYTIEKTGNLGDALGGLLGPIIAFFAAVLTFCAFYIQYRANQIQQNAILEQGRDAKKQRFEDRYFDLVKIYRETVSELEFGKFRGKKVFVGIFEDFRNIYQQIEQYLSQYGEEYHSDICIELTYLIIYYGTGKDAIRILQAYLPKHLTELTKDNRFRKILNDVEASAFGRHEGCQNTLGHYFRHLYLTVKYVRDYDGQSLNLDKKYYIKILRAQLSNYEAALLFYNSLSHLGSKWKTENLISDYELIKNLPVGLVREVDPKEVYPAITFEWED